MESEAEIRIGKALEEQRKILRNIEDQLKEVVRLDERVINIDKVITTYGETLGEHEKRIRNIEVKHARLPNVNNIETKVEVLKSRANINRAKKDVIIEVVKFFLAIAIGAVAGVISMKVGK